MKKLNKLIIVVLLTLPITLMSFGNETTSSDNCTAVKIKGVSEVVIYFNASTGERNEVFRSADKTEFSKFTKIISCSRAPSYKCGYTGSIVYKYNDGTELDCDFNLDESCNHIVYIVKDKLRSKKLTKKGRLALLTFMEKGKSQKR